MPAPSPTNAVAAAAGRLTASVCTSPEALRGGSATFGTRGEGSGDGATDGSLGRPVGVPLGSGGSGPAGALGKPDGRLLGWTRGEGMLPLGGPPFACGDVAWCPGDGFLELFAGLEDAVVEGFFTSRSRVFVAASSGFLSSPSPVTVRVSVTEVFLVTFGASYFR